MVRARRTITTSLAIGVLSAATACSSDISNPPGSPPGQTPPPPSVTRTPSSVEMTAVGLGVTVMSADDLGAPRIIRAVVPRATSRAAMTPDQAARDHVTALAPLWVEHDRPADLVSGPVQKLRNGAAIVSLGQRIDQIDVHQGDLRVMVHVDGSLAAVSGTLRPASDAAAKRAFRLTARDALSRALDELYGTGRAKPAIADAASKAGYQHLAVTANSEFRVKQSRAKRVWFPEADRLVAAWSVELLAEKQRKLDGWRYLVGDADRRILRKVDLIQHDAFLYRAFVDQTGNRRPLDGAMKSYNPHPTGTPDDSLPGFASANLSVMDSFNGPRDPWLPSNATTTAGNNVETFADITSPNGFNEGDIRPNVTAGRILNFTYNLRKEPLANADQSKAAATNLFFVNNWLHDWYYDSGFTEATGNAQLDNFGRGGIDGDRLIGHAQRDATVGARDNAFIFVPGDGMSPEMNMFLFSTLVDASVTVPTGTFEASYFTLGPRNFDVSGLLALVDDGTGTTTDGCEPITTDLTGKIALVDFAFGCDDKLPVENAKNAGAIAVVSAFAVPGAAPNLIGSYPANLPGLTINMTDGAALKVALESGPVQVSLHRESSTVERDSDFDNAIVAHEWGHYLHLRLASCEAAQCGAMSEGWGDFVALHMMLRGNDDRTGTYAEGLYALSGLGFAAFGFDDPGFFGIRRFAYSIDRTKNALSFRHIGDDNELPTETPVNAGPVDNGNSEVHNAGEIWATMLWEVFNVLIDEHSINGGRRRMSDYVVAGLLLTPPDATFTEGRDGILAAAAALDTDDMLLMAAAFAGRGAGTCAVSPGRTSSDFVGVVESGTIDSKIEVSPPTLRDDGVSCDQDNYLDPGESGTLHVTVANGGILPANDVVVELTTTSAGVTVGGSIDVGAVEPFASVDLEIPVTIAASAPVDSLLDLTLRIDGEAGCATSSIAVPLQQRMGVDDVPEMLTTDNFEPFITPWTPTGEGADALWNRVASPTGNHSMFGTNAPFTSDTQLTSPVLQASHTDPLVVTLAHTFDLEAFLSPDFQEYFDGGVIEVSTDNGATWTDAVELGANPEYNATVSECCDNPLIGRPAYSSTNMSFPDRDDVTLDFGTQFAGKAVQLRFRIGTDFCCVGTGWDVDDVSVTGIDNTPFPGIVPEESTCSAEPVLRTSPVVSAIRVAPEVSLDGLPDFDIPDDAE